MTILTAFALILFQEIDSKEDWNVTQSGDIAVAAIGGSITVSGTTVKILDSKRYIFRSGGKIIDAEWDGRKLTKRRTVAVKGALKSIALMPPLGKIELEGTDGEADLSMEILEEEEGAAKPAIDKDGKLRMGGAAIVLSLTGKIPKATRIDLRAGAVDVCLKKLAGEIEINVKTSASITLEDIDAKEIEAENSSGDLKASRLKSSTKIKLESTSGAVTAETLEASRIKVEATSGEVRVTSTKGGRFEINATSGDVHLKSIHNAALDIESTSGNVELVESEGDELKIDATSGDVTLRKVKFEKRKVDTTSGTVTEE